MPALYDLNPQRVLQMLSFSKLVGPGPRVGLMFGPADLLQSVGKIAEDTYITPSLLSHGIVYEFCNAGALPGQIEQLKALYAPRLQACLDVLDEHLRNATGPREDIDSGTPARPPLPPGYFIQTTLSAEL